MGDAPDRAKFRWEEMRTTTPRECPVSEMAWFPALRQIASDFPWQLASLPAFFICDRTSFVAQSLWRDGEEAISDCPSAKGTGLSEGRGMLDESLLETMQVWLVRLRSGQLGQESVSY